MTMPHQSMIIFPTDAASNVMRSENSPGFVYANVTIQAPESITMSVTILLVKAAYNPRFNMVLFVDMMLLVSLGFRILSGA